MIHIQNERAGVETENGYINESKISTLYLGTKESHQGKELTFTKSIIYYMLEMVQHALFCPLID